MRWTAGWGLSLLVLVACGKTSNDSVSEHDDTSTGSTPSSAGSAACPAGAERCPCRSDGTCDGQLVCASEICVVLPGGGGRPGSGGTAGVMTGGTAGVAAAGEGGTLSGTGGSAGTGGALAGGTGGTSGSGGASTGGDGTGGTGGTGGSGTGGGGTGGGGGFIPPTGGYISTTACDGYPYEPRADCTSVATELEPLPVDAVIMMDRSDTMTVAVDGGTRWDALQQGMQDFVSSPDAADAGVSIDFYGRSGNDDETIDCEPDRYRDPGSNEEGGPLGVPVGSVSTAGLDVLDAMAAVTPGGSAPTYPAALGGMFYASDWADAHPERATVFVFVSDGQPTLCSTDTDVVRQIFEYGFTRVPSVRTYAVGVGIQHLGNLNGFASAGGTRQAWTLADTNLRYNFLAALEHFVSGQDACAWRIPTPPAGESFDPRLLQLLFEPSSGGDMQELYYVGSLSGCGGSAGGWYYDDLDQPNTIHVCPCICSNLANGTLNAQLGCQPLGLEP